MKRLMLIVVGLLLLPSLVLAQQPPLTQTYTSDDGALKFDYPEGWVADGFGTMAMVGSSAEVTNLAGDDLQSGQVLVTVIATSAEEIRQQLSITGEIKAEALAKAFLKEAQEGNIQITLEPTTIPNLGVEAIKLAGVEGQTESFIVIMILADSNVALVVASTPPGEAAAYEETLLGIAASLVFTPPAAGMGGVALDSGAPPVAGRGAVVWQQQRKNDGSIGAFGSLGAVATGADGRVYIADGFSGVRVLDDTGNVLETLSNFDVNEYSDIALDPDGTLWVADAFGGKVYNIDASGSILSEFGEEGSAPGQFGSFSPEQIELAADGTLYTFDSQQDANGNNFGRVQVFDRAGNFLREFPSDPNGESARTSFISMGLAPDGTLYIADFSNGLAAFDGQSGALLAENIHDDLFGFASIEVIAFDAGGSMYIATSSAVFHFDAGGQLVTRFGTEQASVAEGEQVPAQPGEFSRISGMAVLPDGSLVIADTNFTYSQVVRVDLSLAAVPVTDDSGLTRQWANTASATSQYGDTSWSAQQATGAPDTTECGDITTAWASASSSGIDIITLGFSQAVQPRQVNIHQTYNPGSIVRVELLPADGSPAIALPNSTDPPGNTPCPGVFSINVSDISVLVNGVMIYLDQSNSPSWNELDAVELVGLP